MPRLAIVGVVLLLASATLAVGAAKRLTAVPNGAPAPLTPATVVVPDVTGQAFVFAKGTLEDTGFAWHVVGSVHGYAANKVSSQTPAPGTKLRDFTPFCSERSIAPSSSLTSRMNFLMISVFSSKAGAWTFPGSCRAPFCARAFRESTATIYL